MRTLLYEIALRMIDNSYKRAITLGHKLHSVLEKTYPGITETAYRDSKIIGFPVDKNDQIITYHLFNSLSEAKAWATQAARGHAIVFPGDNCCKSDIKKEDILNIKYMKHEKSVAPGKIDSSYFDSSIHIAANFPSLTGRKAGMCF